MNLPPPRVCQRIIAVHALIGSSIAKEARNACDKLHRLLVGYGLTWGDLPAVLAAVTNSTHSYTAAFAAEVCALHASVGSADPTEADNSRIRLIALLHENASSWNDVSKVFAAIHASASAAASAVSVNVLGLIMRVIEEHVAISFAEHMAVGLWILHTYTFDRFVITPRLVIRSPVRGCGKTTLLALLELLSDESFRVDDVSAAAIYHQLDRRPGTTLLVDEADNLGLLNNRVLRSVFNSGHRRGGSVGRFVGGWPRKFATFSPLAVAAIGATETLPLPLLDRSLIINMQRFAPSENQPELKLLDDLDPAFPAVRQEIRKWAEGCQLAPDPAIPRELRNRAADNWRPLLSIADNLGHGSAARAAAIELNANRPDEDAGVTLLADIRIIFSKRGVDRIASLALIESLHGLDDARWTDWRGPNDDRSPRRLTQGDLSRLLRPFGIRPKTIWPSRRQAGDRSAKGYLRVDFETVWARYCPSDGAAAQPNTLVVLARS